MNKDQHGLRKKTLNELFNWTKGWKPHTAEYMAGQFEIKRREQAHSRLISWIALGLSVISLLVSVFKR